jgi:hypothetical protein
MKKIIIILCVVAVLGFALGYYITLNFTKGI